MESPLQKARKELEGRITNREGAKSQVAEESTSPYGRMSPLQMAIGDLKKKLDSRAKLLIIEGHPSGFMPQ
jgi:hypothetical protein